MILTTMTTLTFELVSLAYGGSWKFFVSGVRDWSDAYVVTKHGHIVKRSILSTSARTYGYYIQLFRLKQGGNSDTHFV
jgi:hypothetical protein